MSFKFYPVMTQDGSIGLFNEEVGDIYHSIFGAYTEAVQKFISPSELVQNLTYKNEIKILDICYGMGYNTKAAIDKIVDIDYSGKVLIDALELDENVAAFSFLSRNPHQINNLLDFVDFEVFDSSNLLNSIFSIIENPKFVEFCDAEIADFFKNNKNTLYKVSSEVKTTPVLHNI